MANGEFLNLCSDCIESTDTSAMEYCGLTMSLAPDCDKCGKVFGGKFGYYKPSEVDPAEFYRHGGGTTRGDGGF